jgi:CheY-like chemotaxis protein
MKKVLIIDDEEAIGILMGARFRHEGYEVAVAKEPRQGIELAKSFQPDAILCDIIMPEVSGWKVCHYLRDDPATAHIPIFIITASTLLDANERAAALRIEEVFQKPIETADVIHRLEGMLMV